MLRKLLIISHASLFIYLKELIQNLKIIIILISSIVLAIDFTNGYNCFDGSKSDDCSCDNQGFCNCDKASVRQGLPCNIVNSVDSVGPSFLGSNKFQI